MFCRHSYSHYTIISAPHWGFEPQTIESKSIVLPVTLMGKQMEGIELSKLDWKSNVLPLNYICVIQNSDSNWNRLITKQLCCHWHHSGVNGQRRTRTFGVSYVTDLQSAVFAAGPSTHVKLLCKILTFFLTITL